MHATPRLIIGSALLTVGAVACATGGPVASATTGTTPIVFTSTKNSPAVHTPALSPPATLVAPGVSLLPAPKGPFSVGVVNLALPNAIAFYPAKVNTGTGRHRYVEAKLLTELRLPIKMFSTLTTTSRVGATPLPTKSPRPVRN